MQAVLKYLGSWGQAPVAKKESNHPKEVLVDGIAQEWFVGQSRSSFLRVQGKAPILDLSRVVDGASLAFTLSLFKNLAAVDISYCPEMHVYSLKKILETLRQNSPMVKHFNAAGLDALDDETLALLLKNFPKLEVLIIDHCKNITDQGMQALLGWIAENPNLKILSVAGNKQISAACLLEIFQSVRNQEILNLNGLNVSADDISCILDAFSKSSPMLIQFQAAQSVLQDSHLSYLVANFCNLRGVNFASCESLSQDALITFFDSSPSLQQVSLQKLTLSDNLLQILARRQKCVEYLNLSSCKVSPNGFLAACQNWAQLQLRHLYIGKLPVPATIITQALTALNPVLSKLESLDFSHPQLEENSLSIVADSQPRLVSLTLQMVLGLKDASFANFFKVLSKSSSDTLRTVNLRKTLFYNDMSQTSTVLANEFKGIEHYATQVQNYQIKVSQVIPGNSNIRMILPTLALGGQGTAALVRVTKETARFITEKDEFFPGSKQLPRLAQIPSQEEIPSYPANGLAIGSLGMEFVNGSTGLDLFQYPNATYMRFHILLSSLPSLSSIELEKVLLSELQFLKILHKLKSHSPGLQYISTSTACSNACLGYILDNFKELQGLDFSSSQLVTEEICPKLVDWIKNNSLRALGIGHMLNSDSVREILLATRDLTSLSLIRLFGYNYVDGDYDKLLTEILQHVSNTSPHLTELNTYYSMAFCTLFSKLPSYFPNLQRLCMPGPGPYIDGAGGALIQWEKLNWLRGVYLNGEDFLKVAQTLCFTAFDLDTYFLKNGTELINGCEALAQNSKGLQYLSLRSDTSPTTYTSEDLYVALDFLVPLLSQLKALVLRNGAISDKILDRITPHLNAVKQFNCGYSSFGDNGITAEGFKRNMKLLAKINKDIEFLSVYATNLVSQNPEENVLKVLALFTSLRYLDLGYGLGISSTFVEEAILLIVEANPNIHMIRVYGGTLSDEEFKKFINKHPHLANIVFISYGGSGGLPTEWCHFDAIKTY